MKFLSGTSLFGLRYPKLSKESYFKIMTVTGIYLGCLSPDALHG